MANEEMIQKHIDNFLAKIAGETPVDDTIQNSTEFWINKIAEQGGGGTEVVANPTLAGTEDDLTAIEIDGVKYKVPKGAYIAAKTDSTHITTDSFNFIYANHQTIPCFVPYLTHLYRIASIGSNTLISAPVDKSSNISDFNLAHIFIGSDGTIREGSKTVPAVAANQTGSTSDATLTAITINGQRYRACDGIVNGLKYFTSVPSVANNDGLKIVVLSSEPATKYNGWLYIILA